MASNDLLSTMVSLLASSGSTNTTASSQKSSGGLDMLSLLGAVTGNTSVSTSALSGLLGALGGSKKNAGLDLGSIIGLLGAGAAVASGSKKSSAKSGSSDFTKKAATVLAGVAAVWAAKNMLGGKSTQKAVAQDSSVSVNELSGLLGANSNSNGILNINTLLGALGGEQAAPEVVEEQTASSGLGLDDLMGLLGGGTAAKQTATSNAGGLDLMSLLGSSLGGSSTKSASSGLDIASLLGAAMGATTTAAPAAEETTKKSSSSGTKKSSSSSSSTKKSSSSSSSSKKSTETAKNAGTVNVGGMDLNLGAVDLSDGFGLDDVLGLLGGKK